jgi:beta-glucanase (GH16 family)|mmetsp:Transcript_13401/g.2108  ORF Transcript_13401/g.2108 Transcript_13401/m.2108 type:complete len:116 (+) Transcript_13401:528-875(+)
MLPVDDVYGTWPASGEIDILESRGNVNYPGGGNNSFGTTLHFGPGYPYDPYMKAHAEYTLENETFSDDFHIIGLYWDENQIYTYVDDDSNRVLNLQITEDFWKLGEFPSNVNNPW